MHIIIEVLQGSVDLTGANLSGANLGKTNLTNARCCRVDFSNVVFQETNLDKSKIDTKYKNYISSTNVKYKERIQWS
ncbi:MAG: pentapeptide repeat-containing protein [Leptospiraceae bacterium]|nr:pentapeptide repeat-containing protein [Leptospiraceae bacterium]MCP5494584.1 pentapeptide repeat-containing protein [Leptospiraceae bacterium]